jgi:psiF repeat
MQRIAFIAVALAATAVLSMPHALAQTPAPKASLTPEQHQQVKAMNVKFTACHNQAVTAKVAPKDRRAFMKNCLASAK